MLRSTAENDALEIISRKNKPKQTLQKNQNQTQPNKKQRKSKDMHILHMLLYHVCLRYTKPLQVYSPEFSVAYIPTYTEETDS